MATKKKDPSWKKIKAASEAPQQVAPRRVPNRDAAAGDMTFAEAFLPQDLTRRAMQRNTKRSSGDSSWYAKHPGATNR
jgi:hypothetical protein